MSAKDDDILKAAREAFALAEEVENENRNAYEDDVRFARLEEQWPDRIRRDRELDGRPCLTISHMAPFIRQVVNDARQNAPSIVVHPVDDKSDPETAEIFNGLIRNAEQSSDAEVAYDTALDCAVTGGFGYFRINTRYACDDTFDQDIVIERISNPLCVYGDPKSTAADSSDWDVAFVVDKISKAAFEKKYPEAEAVSWSSDDEADTINSDHGDDIQIAEYWTREPSQKAIVLLSDGSIVDEAIYKAQRETLYDPLGLEVRGRRDVESHQVVQRILSGAAVLETVKWAGKFIPIIPVYGDEVVLDGKRHFRSLIRGAKDAQRMFNYWRTTSTELVALAPKAPFIGRKGAFETDAAKWVTANTANHAYIEYDGQDPPQRQPFTGVPAGALQEALNAADDMKAIMGLYDASLGAKSNETSGKAIMARQREGDVSTFHFIDNLSRAIRHAGRIMIDLIPHVYPVPRVVRTIGPDGEPEMAQVNQPFKAPQLGPDGKPQQDPQTGELQEIEKIYDLTVGKYDLVVKTGPSFATKREEFVAMASELMRGNPTLQQVLTPMIVKNFDIPDADEIVKQLEAAMPNAPNPQLEQAKQIMGQMQQALKQTQDQLTAAKADSENKARELEIEQRRVEIEAYEAETQRIEARAKVYAAEHPPEPPEPPEEGYSEAA